MTVAKDLNIMLIVLVLVMIVNSLSLYFVGSLSKLFAMAMLSGVENTFTKLLCHLVKRVTQV